MLVAAITTRGLGAAPPFTGITLDAPTIVNVNFVDFATVEHVGVGVTQLIGVPTIGNVNTFPDTTVVAIVVTLPLLATLIENVNTFPATTEVTHITGIGHATIANVNEFPTTTTVTFPTTTQLTVAAPIANANTFPSTTVVVDMGETSILPFIHEDVVGGGSGSTDFASVDITTTVPTILLLETFSVSPLEYQRVTSVDGEAGAAVFGLVDEQEWTSGGNFYHQSVWVSSEIAASTNYTVTAHFDDITEDLGNASLNLLSVFGANAGDPIDAGPYFAHGGVGVTTPQVSGVDTLEDVVGLIEFFSGFGSPPAPGGDYNGINSTLFNFVTGKVAAIYHLDDPVTGEVADFVGDRSGWGVVSVPIKADVAVFPMTVLWADNLRLYANDAALTAAGYVISDTGHATVQTSGGRTGSGGLVRCTDDDTNDCRKALPSAVPVGDWIHFCGYMNMHNAANANGIPLGRFIRFYNSVTANSVQITTASGTNRRIEALSFRAAGSLGIEAASPGYLLSHASVWVHIEWAFINHDTTGRYKVWIDESLIIDYTGDTSSGLFSAEQLNGFDLMSGTSTVGQTDWNDIVVGKDTGGNQIGFHYVDDAGVPHLL